MRRLIKRVSWVLRERGEQGVSGVLVALMMLVLIGVGAIAVDVGQIYSERAQLQNAADSGALAVAQSCAASACDTSLADPLADANSLDGKSTVSSVDTTSVAGQVTVKTTTKNGADNGSTLTKLFASALNVPAVSVGASASAGLFPPSGGGAFPLAFSNKCWDLSSAVAAGVVQKISWKPGTTCTNASGHVVPGGWGWLSDPDADCYAVTTTGNIARTDPGNDKPAQCATILQGWINTLNAGQDVKVTFPVYDTASGSGSGAVFHVLGYATFRILGWKFGNNDVYEFRNTTAATGNSNLSCSGGGDRCIIGQFIKYVTTDDAPSSNPAPGQDFGTTEVKLIK
ncbi:TadE/TadG family type IV pilus assembly protein [Pseudarthrobacter sp. J1738]|uniref:TadE/TadG family type IV pilus assembly protein n=1 Tax=unclassified Pseudarthrobacter TaxID=2647000 RepID=UPI003D2E7433